MGWLQNSSGVSPYSSIKRLLVLQRRPWYETKLSYRCHASDER